MNSNSFKGNLYCLMGKSCTGKDTLYKKLLGDDSLGLKPLVTYTTRPLRTNEVNGRDYHFVSIDQIREFESKGQLIEERIYQTVNGPWHYATIADEQIQSDATRFLCIVTLEAFTQLRDYFGEERVIPLYIQVDERTLLERAIARESNECKPNYKEVCRRFLADSLDFSQERLVKAGVERYFDNTDLVQCMAHLKSRVHEKEFADGSL